MKLVTEFDPSMTTITTFTTDADEGTLRRLDATLRATGKGSVSWHELEYITRDQLLPRCAPRAVEIDEDEVLVVRSKSDLQPKDPVLRALWQVLMNPKLKGQRYTNSEVRKLTNVADAMIFAGRHFGGDKATKIHKRAARIAEIEDLDDL